MSSRKEMCVRACVCVSANPHVADAGACAASLGCVQVLMPSEMMAVLPVDIHAHARVRARMHSNTHFYTDTCIGAVGDDDGDDEMAVMMMMMAVMMMMMAVGAHVSIYTKARTHTRTHAHPQEAVSVQPDVHTTHARTHPHTYQTKIGIVEFES